MDEEGDAELDAGRKAGELLRCLLIWCRKSKCVFAHVVPCEGVDEDDYAVDLVVKDASWLGYTTIILKADNKNTIRALLARVIDLAAATILPLE